MNCGCSNKHEIKKTECPDKLEPAKDIKKMRGGKMEIKKYHSLNEQETNDYIRNLIKKEGDIKTGVYKDYEFVIRRPRLYPGSIHLSGYVSIPYNHKYYKEPYNKIDIKCHGGLTFAGEESLHRFITSEKDKTDIYWIGFDCLHYMDLGVIDNKPCPDFGNIYRDMDYCMTDIKSIISQLITKDKK